MSEDLLLEGKKFISVSRASSLTGYTQDYLGQLCRQEKVPARMVGRTWYLDSDALFLYKKDLKSRKKNFPNPVVPEAIKTVRSDNYVSPFKFEKDSSPLLPVVAAKVKTSQAPRVPHSKTLILICLAVLLLSGASWLNYVSPRTTEIVSATLFQSFAEGFNRAGSLSAEVAHSDTSTSSRRVGIVAFPDPAAHDQAVGTVESAFSDEVSTKFDSGGTSGVITPVFGPGGVSDNYAFVMVPINQTK